MSEFKPHYFRIGRDVYADDAAPSEVEKPRRKIEPWLSAIFQSEHFNVLLGSGFTSAIAAAAKTGGVGMEMVKFPEQFAAQIDAHARATAKGMGRGAPNIEDQIRAALALALGLRILGTTDKSAADSGKKLTEAVNGVLKQLLGSILKAEQDLKTVFGNETDEGIAARRILESFLLSCASRAATRERLHLFTTNYDRLIEYGCDLIGLRIVDRFVGTLRPLFRSSRIEVDLHYNPPGIRGEPRYLEGVAKLSKLHGSIDWRFEKARLAREGLPFGAPLTHSGVPENLGDSVMIYPNPAKDLETLEYPYADLFRDFSAALCRPNSALLTYGYGFGDDHINRVIADMLTIPSTHLVIIAYSDDNGRIANFTKKIGKEAQISILLGMHFGHLPTLIENYFPKPAIDTITIREATLKERRGEAGRPAASPAPAIGTEVLDIDFDEPPPPAAATEPPNG